MKESLNLKTGQQKVSKMKKKQKKKNDQKINK